MLTVHYLSLVTLFNKEDKDVAFTYLNVFSINEYSSELNMKLFQAVSIIPRM